MRRFAPLTLVTVLFPPYIPVLGAAAERDVVPLGTPNLVANGGFEAPSGPNGIPASWSAYVPGATATLRTTGDQAREGGRSALLETNADVKAILVSDAIPVASGEKLGLRIWCRVEDLTTHVGGTLSLSVGFLDAQRHYFDWHREQPAPPKAGEWRLLTTEATVPAQAAYVTFQVGLNRMIGKTWWDGAELRTASPLAIRFDLPSATCEPGEYALPLVLLNRDPRSRGRSVALMTDPGGHRLTHRLSGKPVEAVSAVFTLRKRGKLRLAAALIPQGAAQPAFCATADVTVPPLLRTEPLVPTHHCIEDGTPKLEGRLWVHEEADRRAGMTLQCSIRDAHKELARWNVAPLPPNPIAFARSVPECGLGEYTVNVALLRGNDRVSEKDLDWHVIRRAEAEVKLGQDGYLIVGGKPFFPIGMFNGGRFVEQAAAGFNVTHSYNVMAMQPGEVPDNDRVKRFLDETHAAEMKALMLVTHGAHARAVNDEVIRRVRMFRNHPGLLAWDEEEGVARGETPLSFLKELRAMLQREAPERPFMVGDCRDAVFKIKDRSELFPADYMDMGMWWWYPFPMTPAVRTDALQGEEATKGLELAPPSFLALAKTRKPIWVGIQAYRKPERTDGRFPTPTEYRAQAYVAVIHGAKGLMYYVGSGSRGNGILNKPEEGNWAYLKSLVTELRSMAPVFMSPDAQEAVTIEPRDALISTRLKDVAGGRVLLAANRGEKVVRVTFRAPSLEGRTARVRFENRNLQITEGGLVDEFSPYAAHVYDLP